MKTFLVLLVSIAVFGCVSFFSYKVYLTKSEELFEKGMSELKEENFKSALNKLEPYAYKGNRLARKEIGKIYALGLDVPIDNLLAEKWLSCEGIKSCIDGEAECVVSYYFKNGTFGKKDLEKARYWMDKSIHKGYKCSLFLTAKE
jgi:TPR repeat protein